MPRPLRIEFPGALPILARKGYFCSICEVLSYLIRCLQCVFYGVYLQFANRDEVRGRKS
jgi:hypothetical protein